MTCPCSDAVRPSRDLPSPARITCVQLTRTSAAGTVQTAIRMGHHRDATSWTHWFRRDCPFPRRRHRAVGRCRACGLRRPDRIHARPVHGHLRRPQGLRLAHRAPTGSRDRRRGRGAGSPPAPPAERGCTQRRQARAGREAHGAHAGAVRRDDRSRPRQRRKADGGSDQPLPARVHQSQGNPGLRAVGTPDHHRELHVQELELRQPPAAIPQPLSRRRYVAEQRRSRGGPGHLVHGLPGHVGVGLDWYPRALPGR